MDRCAACGRLLEGENLTDETTAHWSSPFGADIAAWSCGGACADKVEATRRASGLLLVI